jgi:hypothetical protein
MHEFGFPGWIVALALAIAFSAAAVIVAVATGLFVILLPALAVVASGYGVYAAVASRRQARFDFRLDRFGVIQHRRTPRRRSRPGGRTP